MTRKKIVAYMRPEEMECIQAVSVASTALIIPFLFLQTCYFEKHRYHIDTTKKKSYLKVETGTIS